MNETPPMDDYDAGIKEGLDRAQRDMNRIIALKEDLAYEKGYEKGVKDSADGTPQLELKTFSDEQVKKDLPAIKILGIHDDVCRMELDIPESVFGKLAGIGKQEATADDYVQLAILKAMSRFIAEEEKTDNEEDSCCDNGCGCGD